MIFTFVYKTQKYVCKIYLQLRQKNMKLKISYDLIYMLKKMTFAVLT